MELMKTWNKKHGVILHLEPDGFIIDDTENMIDLWREVGSPGMDYD